MALGKGSGIFNLQFGGEFTKKRRQGLTDYSRAESELGKGFDQAIGYQQPYYDYGQNALRRFQDWEKDPNAITSDPSYQWRLNQGLESVENSAAARGGALSGNALRAITDYGQGAASQEYNNEFQRWLQRLGIGQGAAANMSNLAAGRGNALANLIAQGSESQWNRLLGQAETTRLGELATNSIVQSWVPAQYGGGKSTSTGTPAFFSGGGNQGGGNQGGANSDLYNAFASWTG